MSIQTTKKQFKCGIIVIIAILIMLSPIMAFASPNIGDTAIWRISHEEITPTCTYVDVRVYLYRTTAAGMGFTMFTIGYDPTVLANPRRTPDRLRFDSSLLTPGQIPSYNWMVSNGATEDELIGAFPNAVVNDAYYDGTLAFLLTLYDNGNGHVHGQNIVLLTWNQLVGHPGHMGSDIFVYIRFDIASGATVNYESFVRFTDHVRFMGGEDGHSFNPLDLIDGSVTIICNAPTLTVQSPVTINDDNLTATSNVGGTATGSISLSYTAPAGVTVSEAGGVITVTGERPDIGGTTINEAFTVEVTRGTLSQNLIVNVHLTPLTADPTLTVQSPVTINDDNLTATSNVGGTATGPITLDYTAPAGVTVSEADGVITVTGERPAIGGTTINEPFTVEVTRGTLSQNLIVNVHLTPLTADPTLTVQSPVTINDGNLTATSNVGGTATGPITLDYTAPAGVTVSEADGVITVTGERPAIGGTTINEPFTVEVTRGTLSQNLIVNVHLTPLTADPTISLNPAAVTVNNASTSVTSTVLGTATGNITLNTVSLPAGVSATVNQTTGVITVTGTRPATGQQAITGTFTVPVTRQGVTAPLTVVVNLTPWPPEQPTDPPTLPTDPTQPTVPAQPTEPTQPTVPTEPTVSTDPTQPQQRDLHLLYMIGSDEGNFMPRGNITRAQVATIMARIMLLDFETGIDVLPAGMTAFDRFSDVEAGQWWYYYVAWAYDAGFVKGYDDGTFRPDNPITRQEFAALLARTIDYATEAGETSFVDADAISDWAAHYVYTVYRELWMRGNDAQQFNPQANLTRAEAATTINRILERIYGHPAFAAADVVNLPYAILFPDVTDSAWYFPAVVAATNDHYLTRTDAGQIDWKYILSRQQ